MSEISRTALFGKLNTLAYKAIEGATVFCKMRGNPYVELEHWFAQLLQQPDSDLHRVIQHYGLDVSVLARDITAALDRLPRGATAISDFSPHIENAIERAWTYATLQFGEAQVRTGYLLIGMIKTQSLRNPLVGLSREFDKVKAENLADNFASICDPSPEGKMRAQDGTGMGSGAPGEDSGAMAPAAMGKGEALKKFAVDLTEKAKKGETDPISGRDEEIRQIVDILMRRRQNNPLLTGEAGVGKTAVVEGFAQRLARGDVPPQLKDVKLLTLDIGLLQAGASMKGEFEQRLRQVIDEVQSSPTPIILFIDEIHTLVGAGGAAGTGDAANLLKPALARGNLRTIGATTWAEYKKYIEKDPALTRRFQVVQVPEPDEAKAILMLRGVASVLEKHHRVQLLDEAIAAAVKLSHRYIPARQLPDKAISLLDTACARVAVSQHATPPEVEDCQRRIEALTIEQEIIGREEAIGIDVAKRSAQVVALLAEAKTELEKLDARWKEEKGLVDRLLALRGTLRDGNKPVDAEPPPQPSPASGGGSENEDRTALLAELHELQARIAQIQGESPLILPSVDEQAVASVVADWTGIPVGRMVKNEIEAILQLAETLNQRVIGQRHGLEMVAKRIQTSRARLDNPQKPIGVFMLCGTSGVGKTETALALAEALYGGEQNVITINMSEFQEAHTVSTLKGAPPGYVGYGEGGILTEAVRRRPYSVVLLDEVEKAHPDVHEIFFQVFDKGWMEDGEGRVIDFKNTIILLTTNAGSDLVMSMCRDPELLPAPGALADALKTPLLKIFPPALLGRLVTIPYYPLSPDMMKKIIELQLGRIKKRVTANHGVPFEYTPAVVEQVLARCNDAESGGRVIDANYNEFRFEDAIGKEQIHLHAEKDLDVLVEEMETRKVGTNSYTKVAGEMQLSVGEKRTADIGGDDVLKVVGDQSVSIAGDKGETVNGATKFTSLGDWHAAAPNIEVNGTVSYKLSSIEISSIATAAYKIDAATFALSAPTVALSGVTVEQKASAAQEIKAGAALNLGAPVVTVDAQAGLTLECGTSKISMTPAGITIEAPMVKINASAVATIAGAMVKIN